MGIEGLGRVPSQSISQFRHAINTVRLARVSHRPFGSSERTITEFRDWSTRRPRWAPPPVGSRTRPAGSRARRGRPPPRGTRSLRPRLGVEGATTQSHIFTSGMGGRHHHSPSRALQANWASRALLPRAYSRATQSPACSSEGERPGLASSGTTHSGAACNELHAPRRPPGPAGSPEPLVTLLSSEDATKPTTTR